MIEDRLAEARAARQKSNLDRAISLQRDAVDALRVAADLPALAHAVRHLADMLVEAGRHDESGAAVFDMLELYAATQEIGALDRANAVRVAAVHHESVGDLFAARRAWTLVRKQYATIDDEIARLTGECRNQGVEEADTRLAAFD